MNGLSGMKAGEAMTDRLSACLHTHMPAYLFLPACLRAAYLGTWVALKKQAAMLRIQALSCLSRRIRNVQKHSEDRDFVSTRIRGGRRHLRRLVWVIGIGRREFEAIKACAALREKSLFAA